MTDENVLREFILAYFSDSELRTLCADLGLDYDGLPGTSKTDKTRELVGFCARRGDLDRLADTAHNARPGVVGAERSRARPMLQPAQRRRLIAMTNTSLPGVSSSQVDRLTDAVDRLNESLSGMRTSVALLAQRLDAMDVLIIMLALMLALVLAIVLLASNGGISP